MGLSEIKARILKSLFMPKSFKHDGLRVKMEGTKDPHFVHEATGTVMHSNCLSIYPTGRARTKFQVSGLTACAPSTTPSYHFRKIRLCLWASDLLSKCISIKILVFFSIKMYIEYVEDGQCFVFYLAETCQKVMILRNLLVNYN